MTLERAKVVRTSGVDRCHFQISNVLRATSAYTFSDSQFPKVLQR